MGRRAAALSLAVVLAGCHHWYERGPLLVGGGAAIGLGAGSLICSAEKSCGSSNAQLGGVAFGGGISLFAWGLYELLRTTGHRSYQDYNYPTSGGGDDDGSDPTPPVSTGGGDDNGDDGDDDDVSSTGGAGEAYVAPNTLPEGSALAVVGVRSHGDCEAIASGLASLCDDDDCRAMIDDNDGECQDGDCHASLEKVSSSCTTVVCQAIVSQMPSLCGQSDDDCIALAGQIEAQCASDDCKAVIDKSSAECN